MNSQGDPLTEEGGSQRVKYDTKNHIAVLTKMYGSVWPAVMPHCILNTLNIAMIIILDKHFDIDISYSDKGHSFMSMIVSFLVVTRSNIAYSRFMESRSYLANVMASCRELIQYAVTFTRYDTSEAAKKWRYAVARKTIVLLRTVVSVLEFESHGELVWENKVLQPKEKKALEDAVGKDNFRAPMILAMFLRTTIASNAECLDEPLCVSREMKLYQFVSDFVKGYHGLTKLIDTQFPFPLAQMTATFVFVWVYTLPAVLYNDKIEIPFLLLTVFFITYAFIGLECVSVELDDPFGDDPNDFDVLGLIQVVFQDIYICIYDADGEESADKLRKYFEVKALGKQDYNGHHRRTSSGMNRLRLMSSASDNDANENEPGDQNSNFLLQAGKFLAMIASPLKATVMGDSEHVCEGHDEDFASNLNSVACEYGSMHSMNGTSTNERKATHPLLSP